MQISAPAENAVGQDPHFVFHAVVSVNSQYYDPTYGTAAFPNVTTLAPASTHAEKLTVVIWNTDPDVVTIGSSGPGTYAAVTQVQVGTGFEINGSTLARNHNYHNLQHPDFKCAWKAPPSRTRYVHLTP